MILCTRWKHSQDTVAIPVTEAWVTFEADYQGNLRWQRTVKMETPPSDAVKTSHWSDKSVIPASRRCR